MKKLLLYLFIVGLSVSACQQTPKTAPYEIPKTALDKKAMVAAAHPEATRVGMDILKQGGNAVDAAIAVQLTLAVVYQRAGNIGGGGFMIYRSNTGEVSALDYREKAPQAADRDMYLDSAGNVIRDLSIHGHLAVGVPGTVAGLFAAHQKYGKLPFEQLIDPSIALANDGFYLTKKEAETLNKKVEDFKTYNTTPPVFTQKDHWEEGDEIVQKDLAATLTRIKENGRAGFYEGKTADLIVAEMKAGGGIITHEDLKKYEAKWRTPIKFEYKNYTLHSMPPPSSGGIALAQLLGMVEHHPISTWGFHDTRTIHLMIEAERRAYADRADHLGDSDFYDVPIEALVNESYLATRMENFDMNKALLSDSLEAGQPIPTTQSEETTHLSVVDEDGNAVAVTTTLNGSYGSKVVVSGAGFVLNNEMDDFSAKPGVPNMFGLVGKEANAIQPHKRMLSSMTPTIIERDSQLYLVVGTPGGSTIITSVFQVFLNVAEFDMSLEQAINAPRFHHQWLPNIVYTETDYPLPDKTLKSLEALGHTFEERGKIGAVNGILVTNDGQLEGVGDIRRDDNARGY